MRTLFYDQPVGREKDFIDSVLTVLPTSQVKSVETSKSGKSRTITFSTDSTSTLIMKYAMYEGQINTVDITGRFDDLFQLYTNYVNPAIKKQDILSSKCAPITIHPLNNNSLPISFCNSKTSWRLTSNHPH